MNRHVDQHTRLIFIAVILSSLLFSFFLMFRTFGYDSATSTIRVDAKLWSDFGAHIPLIRSFSLGNNWPPQYPGFPGEPIRYHFGFYFLVGILEKTGIRIDWAMNLFSGIGFGLVMICIYEFSKRIFKSTAVGLLSVLFFLFNGSLSFVKFFAKYPLSPSTIISIVTNHRFPSFGPWDGGPVTAFWTLNIYTNQRHLGLAFGLVLLAMICAAMPKKTKRSLVVSSTALTAILYLLLFIHVPGAAIACIFLFWFTVIIPYARIPVLVSLVLLLPWYWFLHTITAPSGTISIHPWYLINPPYTILSILSFWAHNLGLHILTIPLGFSLAPKQAKKILIIPLLVLFIVPNIFQFSPDMINNHKFFNFFLIIGNMFTAFTIVSVFRWIKKQIIIIQMVSFMLLASCFMLLTLSGIIDFFAVINREPGGLPDIEANPIASWIRDNTPPSSVFLNSTWFYHPANLAGRFIFSGYPYFTWSYGYDKETRESAARRIYSAHDTRQACELLTDYAISYIELSENPEYVTPNNALWESIPFEYQKNNVTIWKRDTICSQ